MGKLNLRKLLMHAGVWLIFMLMPVFFLGNDGPEGGYDVTGVLTHRYFWLFIIACSSVFYVNAYYLVPRYYLTKRYGIYAVWLALLFIAFNLLKPFHLLLEHGQKPPRMMVRPEPIEPANNPFPGPGLGGRPMAPLRGGPPHADLWHFDIVSAILFIMIASLGLLLQSVRQWHKTEQRALQAETDKANAELSFLKAQINPHFLFNTLNSIYALAITKSDYTATAVVKLSGMMRYLISESQDEFVLLEKEIAYISDYIELQKMRLGDTVDFTFSVNGLYAGKQIAPLILIAFIENAFKYGVNPEEQSSILIDISVNGPELLLVANNNKVNNATSEAEKTGLGIANAKSRLQFMYPEKHQLQITETDHEFTVTLKINLA